MHILRINNMRTFSDFEKDVLKFMVYNPEPQDMCAIALFEKFCNCYLIRWTEDFSKLILVYDKGENFADIRQKVFDIVVLLNYLEKNYYIGIFPLNLLKSKQIFNHKKYELDDVNEHSIRIWQIDKCTIQSNHPILKDFGECNRKILLGTETLIENTTIGKQIQQYANATYHVTQTLKDFVDNNFQTIDDIKYQKTYCQAWIGIFIAGILSIISICLTIYFGYKK